MTTNKENIEKKIRDSYELPNKVLEIMPNPMVTVRTSTYQHAHYIKQCIEGVLMQKTTFSVEFIIGEDFSTDGTRKIVFEYAKKYPDRIRVMTADYNVGSKANGRRCIQASRGKYMAICEGDDYWTDPYKLQKQVDFLEANPDYGLIHTEGDYYYTKKDEFIHNAHNFFKHKQSSGSIINEILKNEISITTCTVMFRNSLLKSINYDIDSKIPTRDTFLWVELSRLCKFYYLNESTAVRNFLEESASNTKSFDKALSFSRSGYAIYKYFCEKYKDEIEEDTKKYIHVHANSSLVLKGLLNDRVDIARESYRNIKENAGKEYLTLKNKLFFLLTYLPLGKYIYLIPKFIKDVFIKDYHKK